jgi:hypothetical protein
MRRPAKELMTRDHVFLAFDAGQVEALRLRRSWRRRVMAFATHPLEPGTLNPSVSEPNMARIDDLRAALEDVRSRIDAADLPTHVLLPTGVARLMLLKDTPGDDDPEILRFRLAPGLPYGAAHAIVGALPLGPGQCLAAAVYRSVSAEYESLAKAAGFHVERVELSTLAAAAALGRRRLPSGAVDVVLGHTSCCLMTWGAKGIVLVRNRLTGGHDHLDPEWLLSEAIRTARSAGHDRLGGLRAVGPGASRLTHLAAQYGIAASLGWELSASPLTVNAAEIPWLGVALA